MVTVADKDIAQLLYELLKVAAQNQEPLFEGDIPPREYTSVMAENVTTTVGNIQALFASTGDGSLPHCPGNNGKHSLFALSAQLQLPNELWAHTLHTCVSCGQQRAIDVGGGLWHYDAIEKKWHKKEFTQ